MRLGIAIAIAATFVAVAPVPAQRAEPLDAIRQLVGRCRPLAIEAYRTGNTRALDAYVAELSRDRANRQPEIIACGAYLVGAGDAGFYRLDQ